MNENAAGKRVNLWEENVRGWEIRQVLYAGKTTLMAESRVKLQRV